MIVPDVNLLVYAYNEDAPRHAEAREWWESCLSGTTPIGLCWAVCCGFIRLMTHPSVLVSPLDPRTAIGHVRRWMERTNVVLLEPGPRHLDLLEHLLGPLRVAGNLTTDAHLAALAMEHQAEVHSNDTDFARFPGLRWRDPLSKNGR